MTDYLGRLFSYTGMRIKSESSSEAEEAGGEPRPIHSKKSKSVRPRPDMPFGMPGGDDSDGSPLSSKSYIRAWPSSEYEFDESSRVNEQSRRFIPDVPLSNDSDIKHMRIILSDDSADNKSYERDRNPVEMEETTNPAGPNFGGEIQGEHPEAISSNNVLNKTFSADSSAMSEDFHSGSRENVPTKGDESGAIFFRDVRKWVAGGSRDDLGPGQIDGGDVAGPRRPIEKDTISVDCEIPFSAEHDRGSLEFRSAQSGEVPVAETGIKDLHVSIGTMNLTVEGSEAPLRPITALPPEKTKERPTSEPRPRLGRHYIRIR